MAITVGQLLAIPGLGVSLIAGKAALDRPVLWAHVCELPDPWEWLGQGDLLMTIGLGIPADAKQQSEWVRSCATAGLVAVAIGDSAHAPPLTPEMLSCADEVGLPLLLTE